MDLWDGKEKNELNCVNSNITIEIVKDLYSSEEAIRTKWGPNLIQWVPCALCVQHPARRNQKTRCRESQCSESQMSELSLQPGQQIDSFQAMQAMQTYQTQSGAQQQPVSTGASGAPLSAQFLQSMHAMQPFTLPGTPHAAHTAALDPAHSFSFRKRHERIDWRKLCISPLCSSFIPNSQFPPPRSLYWA